jgi:enoyl-CoA hydratase/carnithine racemase
MFRIFRSSLINNINALKWKRSFSSNVLVKFDANVSKGVCKVTLNNPKKRNALSLDLIQALQNQLHLISKRTDVIVMILAHEGAVFSAGHDLNQLLNGSEQLRTQIFKECSEMMTFLHEMNQIVIAQINGPAVAAGFQLMCSCDLVIAHERSSFATPGIKSGLFWYFIYFFFFGIFFFFCLFVCFICLLSMQSVLLLVLQ